MNWTIQNSINLSNLYQRNYKYFFIASGSIKFKPLMQFFDSFGIPYKLIQKKIKK